MSRHNTEILGDVFFRDFDLGIVETLGGVRYGDRYFVPRASISVVPPLYSEFTGDSSLRGTSMPGIPFSMDDPSEVVHYLLPCIHVKREDPGAALERQHGFRVKYRAPAPGAQEVTITHRGREITGYDRYQEQEEATPTDLSYTIMCKAAGKSAKTNAHILLKHCMKRFWPHGKVYLRDSLGRTRSYWVHTEGPTTLNEVEDIRARTINYALTCRVMGEIDVQDSYERKPTTSVDNRFSQKEDDQ